MRRHFDKRGGGIIASLAGIYWHAAATCDHGSRLFGLGQGLLHHVESLLVDQRADQHAVTAWIADLHRTIDLAQFRQKLVINARMHKKPSQGGAALSCRADRCKGNAAQGQIEICRRGDNGGIVAAKLQNGAGKAGRKFGGDLSSHRSRAGGRYQRHAVIIDQCLADIPAADQHAGNPLGQATEFGCGSFDNRLRSQSCQQGFFRRLPDHGIATNQRQSGVPRPDSDRKVEGGNHPANAEWMPSFHHPMVGTFSGNRQAEQLTRQADRIITNVDHFLHFAQALGRNFPGFQRDQTAQIGLAGP